jgi:hypothetical protein
VRLRFQSLLPHLEKIMHAETSRGITAKDNRLAHHLSRITDYQLLNKEYNYKQEVDNLISNHAFLPHQWLTLHFKVI